MVEYKIAACDQCGKRKKIVAEDCCDLCHFQRQQQREHIRRKCDERRNSSNG